LFLVIKKNQDLQTDSRFAATAVFGWDGISYHLATAVAAITRYPFSKGGSITMRKLSQRLMSALVVLLGSLALTACGQGFSPELVSDGVHLASTGTPGSAAQLPPRVAVGSTNTSGEAIALPSPTIAMRHAIVAVTPPSSDVGTFQGDVFRWTRVGGDRCNPRAGCTLQYALERSGWPIAVQQAFLRLVREQAGREVTITRGWQGWMTWGSQTAKFHPNTLADFNQVEPALEWSHVFQGAEFVLIRVNRCQNWGGNTRRPTPPQPTQPATPLVACP
jgi:hypothetical protein